MGIARVALLSLLAITTVACSDSSAVCHWPSSVMSAGDGPMLGCVASINAQSCKSSEYWLVCHGGSPDASLHCRELIFPGVAEYCCPCVK